jgi:hypothetical protein
MTLDRAAQKWYPKMRQHGVTGYIRADFVTP